MLNSQILITHPSTDYALLDSGEGEKLERYGKIILSRPDPQSLWRKNLSENEWQKAGAVFSRDGKSTEWKMAIGCPKHWPIEFAGLTFWIKPTAFKHTGLFPEQASNWEWIKQHCQRRLLRYARNDSVKVLNLFGYTGGASLAAAKAGAEVCHLDGSKVAVSWAKNNAEFSGLKDKPIRWIVDDAITFVKREIKRNRRYDGIIMDPPAFGHGPKGEMWKIEKDFLILLELCRQVLTPKPLFFLINGYASGYSPIAYANNLMPLTKKYQGEIACGELTIAEEKSGRLLPCGIFARWNA